MSEYPPFISRGDLSAMLGVEIADDDLKATIAMDRACEQVRSLTEQSINLVEDDTVVLDGTGTDALLLPQWPVVEVSAVSVADEALTLDTDYKLNGFGVLLRVDGAWIKGRQNVEVTYTHGWADGAMPRDLRGVALDLAVRFHQQQPGIVFESLGQRSVRYNTEAGELNKNHDRILAKYRVPK